MATVMSTSCLPLVHKVERKVPFSNVPVQLVFISDDKPKQQKAETHAKVLSICSLRFVTVNTQMSNKQTVLSSCMM